jgi:hypothetical protein
MPQVTFFFAEHTNTLRKVLKYVPYLLIREIIDFSRCRRENKQSLKFFFALGLRISQEALRWIWFAPNPLYFFILAPLALSRVLYFEV